MAQTRHIKTGRPSHLQFGPLVCRLIAQGSRKIIQAEKWRLESVPQIDGLAHLAQVSVSVMVWHKVGIPLVILRSPDLQTTGLVEACIGEKDGKPLAVPVMRICSYIHRNKEMDFAPLVQSVFRTFSQSPTPSTQSKRRGHNAAPSEASRAATEMVQI